jgi:hypothetical protein
VVRWELAGGGDALAGVLHATLQLVSFTCYFTVGKFYMLLYSWLVGSVEADIFNVSYICPKHILGLQKFGKMLIINSFNYMFSLMKYC